MPRFGEPCPCARIAGVSARLKAVRHCRQLDDHRSVTRQEVFAMTFNAEVELTPDVRSTVVQTRATCPFIGTAVATGALPVRNSAANPLASLDEVRALGNTGGGDLGEVLVLFATGNHRLMRGSSDRLDMKTPVGLFSLEFPGSQGSHAGHSGILQGDHRTLASGRLNVDDFNRLIRRATNGVVTRSDVAHFIAENLHRDPESKVLGGAAVLSLLTDA